MEPPSHATGVLEPAATVVVIRDAPEGIEVLLLERRPRKEGGQSGPSVFPGGKIEPDDRAEHAGTLEESARRAAVRETFEEAGLELAASELRPISRWITPEISPRRFDTWFFICAVDRTAEVQVDGVEMCRHRWLPPRSALEAHHRGEIRLAPPTFVTVSWLTEHLSVADTLAQLERERVLTFRPRICRLDDGACMLYPGDAGYESGEIEHTGPRHRLWASRDGWRYEREPRGATR